MTNQPRVRWIIGTIAVVAIGGAWWIFNHPESASNQQKTDDAFINADITSISPQVSGVIQQVLIEDNQLISAGKPLLQIDDRPFKIALQTANAQVMSITAQLHGLKEQLNRQAATISQAKAVVVADEANIKLALADKNRFTNLAADGAGSLQAKQQAETSFTIQNANLSRDQAGLAATQAQLAMIKSDIEKATADLAAANAKKDAALLDLSYTHLQAPVSGVVAQKAARVGSFVQAGKPLLTLVPLDALYVEANFRETQLANIHVGQKVSLTVDALPGETLSGSVESISPASGVSLSSLPAHNATGNFTKIVQRLPIRIRLDKNQSALAKLRVGMSVEPTIDVSATR